MSNERNVISMERLEEEILARAEQMVRLREELADHERALADLQRERRARLVKPIEMKETTA